MSTGKTSPKIPPRAVNRASSEPPPASSQHPDWSIKKPEFFNPQFSSHELKLAWNDLVTESSATTTQQQPGEFTYSHFVNEAKKDLRGLHARVLERLSQSK
ncbi:MAG: hypothetical protein V4591_09225 [Bdellovibrionota bacterium]